MDSDHFPPANNGKTLAGMYLFGCRQADFIHPEGRDGGSVSTSIPPPISGEKVLQERSVLASLPIDPLYTRH